jgi:hypothetical protein
MPMTTLLTATNLNVIQADLDAAFKQVGEKHGLFIQGRINSYSRAGTDAKGTFTLLVKGDNSTGAETAEALHFQKNAAIYGLKPEDLNQKFTVNDVDYKITGLRLGRRTRNNIMVTRVSDNKEFVMASDTVADALGRNPANTGDPEVVSKNQRLRRQAGGVS